MKTTLLAIIALAISTSAVCADSGLPSRLVLAPLPANMTTPTHGTSVIASIPPLSLASIPGTSTFGSKLDPSSADFAQLGASAPTMPLPSGLILALVAIFVLALRVMGLNHARAMADHERDSYHGKARMFRALHEGGADH